MTTLGPTAINVTSLYWFSNSTDYHDNGNENNNNAISKYDIDISGYAYWMTLVIVRIGITGLFSVTGIITNVINIIIFYRQGILESSCSVCLTALAIADILISFFTTLGSAFMSIAVIFPGYRQFFWDLYRFASVMAAHPRDCFTTTSCSITAFLAFERCFSVVYPFKVKQLFTARRSLIVNAVLYIFVFALYGPLMLQSFPTWVFIPETNSTQLIYKQVVLSARKKLFIQQCICLIGVRSIAIIIVATSNLIIFWKITLSKKFRRGERSRLDKKVTETSKSDSKLDSGSKGNEQDKKLTKSPSKENTLLRMMVLISIFFFICYIPVPLLESIKLMRVLGSVGIRLSNAVNMACRTLEALNVSVNIVIYYRMSSRYRQDFNTMFSCKEKL